MLSDKKRQRIFYSERVGSDNFANDFGFYWNLDEVNERAWDRQFTISSGEMVHIAISSVDPTIVTLPQYLTVPNNRYGQPTNPLDRD